MRFIYTRAFGIFSACVVVVAILSFMQTKGILDPIRVAALQSPRPVIILVENIVMPIKNFFSTLYQLKKIAQENNQLRSEVSTLQQNLTQYQQEALENDALRKELGFVKNTQLSLIPCTVLSENAFGLTDSIILNCGTNEGISEGQAIISQGYLVGKINYAGKNSSTGVLAISSNFSTDAAISQTGVNAIAKGSFGSGIILDQVPQNALLSKGSLVSTAGINENIPKGVLIGEVSDILSSGSDLFKRAALFSPIDFNNLSFVFVAKQ